MGYKEEHVKAVAEHIKSLGFDVYLAEKLTHGVYTLDGKTIVCFEFGMYCGAYKATNPKDARKIGQGYVISNEDYEFHSKQWYIDALNADAPRWAVRDTPYSMKTLDDHFSMYMKSSRYYKV